MLTLQWQCVACNRSTNPVPVPFGYEPPFDLTDLYCVVCHDITRHSAGVTQQECAPIRTMGEIRATVRAEERVENGILELLAG